MLCNVKHVAEVWQNSYQSISWKDMFLFKQNLNVFKKTNKWRSQQPRLRYILLMIHGWIIKSNLFPAHAYMYIIEKHMI